MVGPYKALLTGWLHEWMISEQTNNNSQSQGARPFKLFIHLFLDRGERREKERERNISVREKHQPVASCMRPDWESNGRLFALQDYA